MSTLREHAANCVFATKVAADFANKTIDYQKVQKNSARKLRRIYGSGTQEFLTKQRSSGRGRPRGALRRERAPGEWTREYTDAPQHENGGRQVAPASKTYAPSGADWCGIFASGDDGRS